MKVYRRYGQGTPKALDKKTRVLLAGLNQETDRKGQNDAMHKELITSNKIPRILTDTWIEEVAAKHPMPWICKEHTVHDANHVAFEPDLPFLVAVLQDYLALRGQFDAYRRQKPVPPNDLDVVMQQIQDLRREIKAAIKPTKTIHRRK
jgi:predicted naringenin-chalcone synthase